MIVEGKNAVHEAVKSGKSFEKFFVQRGLTDGVANKIIADAKAAGIKIIFADKETLDRESASGRHQGFVARIGEFKYSSLDDILKVAEERGEPPLIVIADGVEDPHNLGSIIRVCECAGAHGLIIPFHRAVAVNETVVRVSAGASEHLPVARVTNINNVIRDLKDKFIPVYAADPDGQPLYSTPLGGAAAIIIGGEGTGIKRLTAALADTVVKIPMYGKINSLNASVACGVVLYEAVRQRSEVGERGKENGKEGGFLKKAPSLTSPKNGAGV